MNSFDVSVNEELKSMQTWKICIDEPFMNCEFVYPIQQRKVRALIDELRQNDNVLLIVIFGSSVSDRCHIDSDVDLYVRLQHDQKNLITSCFDFAYDLWTNFNIDDRLRLEITKGGVAVYEQNAAG